MTAGTTSSVLWYALLRRASKGRKLLVELK